jgi:nitronate monooxygenase
VVARTADGSEIVRYASISPRADVEGDIEATSMWAGQSAGMIETVKPAGDVIRELVEEASQALRSATGLIRDRDG